MKLITQRLPEIDHLLKCNPVNQVNCPPNQAVPKIPGSPEFSSLGEFLSGNPAKGYYGLLDIAFMIAGFLAFFWLVWGAFQYITAGGDKNKLAAARGRITWAIVGLLITAVAFLIAQLAAQVLPPTGGTSPII